MTAYRHYGVLARFNTLNKKIDIHCYLWCYPLHYIIIFSPIEKIHTLQHKQTGATMH